MNGYGNYANAPRRRHESTGIHVETLSAYDDFLQAAAPVPPVPPVHSDPGGYLFSEDGDFRPKNMSSNYERNKAEFEALSIRAVGSCDTFTVYFDDSLYPEFFEKDLNRGIESGKIVLPDRSLDIDSYAGPSARPDCIGITLARVGDELKVSGASLYFEGDPSLTAHRCFDFDEFLPEELKSMADFAVATAADFGFSKDDLLGKLTNYRDVQYSSRDRVSTYHLDTEMNKNLFVENGYFKPQNMKGCDDLNEESVMKIKSGDQSDKSHFSVFFNDGLDTSKFMDDINIGIQTGKIVPPNDHKFIENYVCDINAILCSFTPLTFSELRPTGDEEKRHDAIYGLVPPKCIEVRFLRNGNELKIDDALIRFTDNTPDAHGQLSDRFKLYDCVKFNEFTKDDMKKIIDFGVETAQKFGLSKDELINSLEEESLIGYPERADVANEFMADDIIGHIDMDDVPKNDMPEIDEEAYKPDVNVSAYQDVQDVKADKSAAVKALVDAAEKLDEDEDNLDKDDDGPKY